MTAITGETGAGKSLILDALGLALGDRGDTDRIRQNAEKTEVSACFNIANNDSVRRWLEDHDFDTAEECLVRRILTRDGRSRGYINGQAATMGQLRTLGAFIIDIHNQHEHQSLLNREQQRQLLDEFGAHGSLCEEVAARYRAWLAARNQLADNEEHQEQAAAHRELLSFQVEELMALNLADGEVEALESEQVLLANAETILTDSQRALEVCSGDGDANQLPAEAALTKACAILEKIPGQTPALNEAWSLLDSARIQVTEAVRTIQAHLVTSELDPARLETVEDRLSQAYQLARKHKVNAHDLPTLCQTLRNQLVQLADVETDAEALAEQLAALQTSYLNSANKLSKKRRAAARGFAKSVSQQLTQLAMAGAALEVALTDVSDDAFRSTGLETVEFLVTTNPGQPMRPLNKIVSGGELSRISLAIQVVAAEHSDIPVLVFDEVDVGVGGATASVIGKLLRALGNKGQVICISHQAQVASCAQHHLLASKEQIDDSAESQLVNLHTAARKAEIARMLGGEMITEKTLSHAEEMLSVSAQS